MGRTLLYLTDYPKSPDDPIAVEAKETWETAAEQFEILANKYPGVPTYGLQADGIRINLASIQTDAEGSLKQYDLVIKRLEKAKASDVQQMNVL